MILKCTLKGKAKRKLFLINSINGFMNKLSIVIPYRNRASHLAKFLQHYRPRIPKAEFLVIEQSIHKPFNRGLIKNIGALQSQADYFIFHDVDMLVQGRMDYSYPESPTHLATHASQFGWKMRRAFRITIIHPAL